MPHTRRAFLGAAAAAAAAAQTQSAPLAQVPKVKFGKVEISRIIVGCNQFYGYSHFNRNFDTVMKDWFTPERVVEFLKHSSEFGINCFQALESPRCYADCERFEAAGGKMHYIVQVSKDPAEVVKAIKPLAIYHQGESTDRLFQQGRPEEVREWCKRARQTGVMVGVGAHNPAFLATVEEQNWDVDFYAGCVYNRTRTRDEWAAVLGKEMVEGGSDVYLQSDPARMYAVLRKTSKPCFAFKVLAAGRVGNIQQAFRTAFESLKPTDGIFVGMFPRAKDEVKENAEIAARILKA